MTTHVCATHKYVEGEEDCAECVARREYAPLTAPEIEALFPDGPVPYGTVRIVERVLWHRSRILEERGNDDTRTLLGNA